MNDNIFQPHYNITDSIKSELDDIQRQSWLIENMLIMPKHEVWLRRVVKVRRAVGTTRIEGASMDEAAVGKLVNRSSGKGLTEDEQANINAIQTYDFINFLSDQPDIPVDELVIRQLNRYFMYGSAETLTPGAYRKRENKVGGFTPPNQGDVPSLMRSFALWLREDSDAHPVLKAGIAHVHLVAVHPFWDGNGRTARGLSTLLLQRSQFGFRKLFSLEELLFNIQDEYFVAVERTLSTRFSSEYDATPWLEFFARAMATEVHRLANSLMDWHRQVQEFHEMGLKRGLNLRQVDGLVFVARTGQMTRADYIEVTGTSPGTASRDLADLVRGGSLTAEGNTRARIYYLVTSERHAETSQSGEQLSLLKDEPE